VSLVKSVFLYVFLAGLQLLGQEPRPIQTVRGEIHTSETTQELAVQLQSTAGFAAVQRANVRSDGAFELHDVPPGAYVLKVVRFPDEIVAEQPVNILGANDLLQIRLPDQPADRKAGAGTISVHALQHPLSKNALRAFAKAQRYSDAGDHAKAIAELRRVLDDTSAEGFAHGNLGAEYLRAGQPAAAIEQLEQAVRLVPDSPVMRTNLAYAFSVCGNLDRAEEEARRALQIDRSHPQAHYLLGHILVTRGKNLDEGVENLKIARRSFPRARIVLAQYYVRHHEPAAARQELQEFLTEAGGDDRAKAERWLAELGK
jgi:tetratricopeptide (TPR) repeat protein